MQRIQDNLASHAPAVSHLKRLKFAVSNLSANGLWMDSQDGSYFRDEHYLREVFDRFSPIHVCMLPPVCCELQGIQEEEVATRM